MNIKPDIKKFIVYFAFIFIISIVVQYIWNLVFYGQRIFGSIDFILYFTAAMTISVALVLTISDK